MLALCWDQVNAWRLRQHSLLERAPRAQMWDVVSHIGGLQAQLMSAAELAAWARVEAVTSEDVQTALWTDRTLVKTWAMRGTLHLLTAEDFPAYVAALRQSRRQFWKPYWLKYHNLTRDDMQAILDGVRDALDGRSLTREQLADEVGRQARQPHVGEKLRSG